MGAIDLGIGLSGLSGAAALETGGLTIPGVISGAFICGYRITAIEQGLNEVSDGLADLQPDGPLVQSPLQDLGPAGDIIDQTLGLCANPLEDPLDPLFQYQAGTGAMLKVSPLKK